MLGRFIHHRLGLVASYSTISKPKRIILIRHGESVGNVNPYAYTETPDWLIPLTEKGYMDADHAGDHLKRVVCEESMYIYVSPYLRTKQTLQRILLKCKRSQIRGIREEPRISEQQFGNFQDYERIQQAQLERRSFGRFYYRLPSGESALDVYDRVTGFFGTLHRTKRHEHDQNIVVVTHGLCLRLFLMRWFQWPVPVFESTLNPPNGAVVVMQREDTSTKYKLIEDAGILAEVDWEVEQPWRFSDDIGSDAESDEE